MKFALEVMHQVFSGIGEVYVGFEMKLGNDKLLVVSTRSQDSTKPREFGLRVSLNDKQVLEILPPYVGVPPSVNEVVGDDGVTSLPADVVNRFNYKFETTYVKQMLEYIVGAFVMGWVPHIGYDFDKVQAAKIIRMIAVSPISSTIDFANLRDVESFDNNVRVLRSATLRGLGLQDAASMFGVGTIHRTDEELAQRVFSDFFSISMKITKIERHSLGDPISKPFTYKSFSKTIEITDENIESFPDRTELLKMVNSL